MNSARKHQFVSMLATALAQHLSMTIRITAGDPDNSENGFAVRGVPQVAKPADASGSIGETKSTDAYQEVAAGLNEARTTEATARAAMAAPYGKSDTARDRQLIGYVVYEDGKVVPKSFDEHRECLESAIKRVTLANEALNKLFGGSPTKQLALPTFEIRPVYAD